MEIKKFLLTLLAYCIIFPGLARATVLLSPPSYQDYAPEFDAASQTLVIPCLRYVQPRFPTAKNYEYFFAVKLVFLPEKWLWETREARLIPVGSDEFKEKCLKP